MVETTLSRVGNSMGVLLPKMLRQEAALENDSKIRLESPRKGVVIITAVEEDRDRYSALKDAEARIAARSKSIKPWPQNTTAKDLLASGKESRSNELLSL